MRKIKWKYYYKNEILKYAILLLILIINLPKATQDCDINNYQWMCDNGDCIGDDELCDGRVDCDDGSDEIAENCIHTECPGLSFRCAYGGCISGNARCNGKKDCSDNSDESPFLCTTDQKKAAELYNKLQGKCQIGEMQCKSGECIDISDSCDGIFNCEDGSDEIAENCAHSNCSQYAFRCGYGACVKGSAKCDGHNDCVDGSDEAAILCGRPRKPKPKPTTTTTKKPTPAVTTTTLKPFFATTPKTVTGCLVPNDGTNIKITDVSGAQIRAGTIIPTNGFLSFACTRGYSLQGPQHIVCGADGMWNVDFPKCLKFCNSTEILKGITTKTRCTFDGEEIPPISPKKPGTVCSVSCAYGFEKPSIQTALFRDTITCTENAEWSYKKVNCRVKCGEIMPEVTPFAKGGYAVNITKVPWHVGIYNNFITGALNRSCSGTIVSPHFVISAAHCFWNTPHLKLYDKSYFKIVAGNIYSEYKLGDTAEQVQIRDVDYIRIPTSYNEDNYKSDVALVRVVRHFIFTVVVRPICIQFQNEQAELYVQSEVDGVFTGWGSDDSGKDKDGNYVLQNVDVKTLSYVDCGRYIKEREDKYQLAPDKFCIGNSFGGTACRGDSGGGFTFRKDNSYYLLGVISHAPLSTLDCARDGMVAITNVLYFGGLIQPFIDDLGY